jgi:hypothetical protein
MDEESTGGMVITPGMQLLDEESNGGMIIMPGVSGSWTRIQTPRSKCGKYPSNGNN